MNILSQITSKSTSVRFRKKKKLLDGNYLLFPDRWKLLCPLVVASQSVDPALNKDQPEFGVLVLPVPLQMLPDRNRLLDKVVQILRNLRSQT